jgi:hypothetical protein
MIGLHKKIYGCCNRGTSNSFGKQVSGAVRDFRWQVFRRKANRFCFDDVK